MRPKRTSISSLNLSRRGIPKEFHNATLDDLKDFGSEDRRVVNTFVRDYIENIHSQFQNNKGIILSGSNGVGKSFIASLIIKYAYVNRYTSRRCTLVEYKDAYTRMWGSKSPSEKEELEEQFYLNFKAVEFLALEEIGKDITLNNTTVGILEDLLRYREERGLVTIICTNYTRVDLIDKYGSSINSLIQGNCTAIRIVDSDKRQEHYKER
ncbi:MAG: hypothetical protein R3Y64_11590 [Peptostreptococcaceae bacterium]